MWKLLQSGGEASPASPLRQASYSLILGGKPSCVTGQPLDAVVTAEERTERGLLSEMEDKAWQGHSLLYTACL